MENFIVTIIIIIIFLPLVLSIVIPMLKKHQEATGDIINYDTAMRKFVYKISLSGEEIISLLKIRNDMDELSCLVDFNRSVIKFTDLDSNREYYFQIIEYDDFSILRLEQVSLIGMSSHIPYKLNPFIVNKLHAEIIPFSQYNFLNL